MASLAIDIGILDCATLPEKIAEKYTSISALVVEWLSPHIPEAKLTRIAVAAGEPLPAVDAFDAYIVPGSELGVYDEAPWMQPMQAFLRELREVKIPVVGICFGHQLMAHSYGGKAANTDSGLCVGVREYAVSGETVKSYVMHQDQVVELPESAQVVGESGYCPLGVLRYDFPALSFQFHPEYTEEFVGDVVDVLEGSMLSADQAAGARSSLALKPSVDLFAREVRAFLEETL